MDEKILEELSKIDYPAGPASDERSTPDELFKPLDKEFHFTLDPCATHENAKCAKHYTAKENGLVQPWKNEIVFMNPPYSKIKVWLHKAESEHDIRHATVVCILPCDTSTWWFHRYLWDAMYHRTYHDVELRFPQGRFKFGDYTTSPQFATIIAIFKND